MNLKGIAFGLVGCIVLSSCGGDSARDGSLKVGPSNDAAQEALDKLEAIDAAISISTNIGGYGELLIAAKPAVDSYVESDPGSELSEAISQAFEGHRLAFNWWQCKFEKDPRGDFYDSDAQSQCRDDLLPTLYSLYPGLGSQIDEAVSNTEEKLGKPLDFKSSALDADSIIQAIWEKTSAYTDVAKSLM